MDGQMKAVIDADFFRNITEYERGAKLFLQVMADLAMEPVMHEFVAGTELKKNKYLKDLLDRKEISVIYYRDYLTRRDTEEYEEYFRAAYKKINHFDFRKGNDIYTYADRGESLGEIRSLYMARKMGYQYFMSDDAGARMLTESFFSRKKRVDVKCLYDVLTMCRACGSKLRWKDINPTVKNALEKRQDRIKELKKLYNE